MLAKVQAVGRMPPCTPGGGNNYHCQCQSMGHATALVMAFSGTSGNVELSHAYEDFRCSVGESRNFKDPNRPFGANNRSTPKPVLQSFGQCHQRHHEHPGGGNLAGCGRQSANRLVL